MKTTMNLCKSSFGRLIAFILCFVMTFTFIPFIDSEGTTANAETQTPTIELGDYVQMGTYYGEPILWRCVGFYKVNEETGEVDLKATKTEYEEGYLPLMLSDKILCLKAFDAAGSTNNTSGTSSHFRGYNSGFYRKSNGSNCWEDSNIRCWLNSTESEENVDWTCGNKPDEYHVIWGENAYDKEAGFLTNFTQSERNCMKEVSQDQLLDRYEYDNMYQYGYDYHRFNTNIGQCVTNFFVEASKAYKTKITDRMFLLDVNQVHEVYQNSETLGTEYYRGKATAKCVTNSDCKHTDLNEENYCSYWLRSPDGSNDSDFVRIVNIHVNDYIPYAGSIGVRPAFYLDLSSTNFVSGDGSVDAPYSLVAGPDVTVDFENEQTNQDINTTILYKNKGDDEWTSGTGGKINLDPNVTYYFKYNETTAATEKNYAVTVLTIPERPDISAPNVESKTDKTVTLEATAGDEYKCGDGEWQDSNVFKDLEAGQSYTFYQRVKATDSSFCSFTSTGKEAAIKFAAPTVSYRTFTSITLKPIEGYVYKCNELYDGEWQENNEFTGLEKGKTYTFYQKKKGTADEKYTSEPLVTNTLTYGEVITSAVGITGVTAYLVAAAKNKLISKWFLTSNGIFGKKVNSWVENLWNNMMS